MKKKNILIIFSVVSVFVVLATVVGLFLYNSESKNIDILKVSDGQIVSLLNKNSDAKDYMQNHSDFKIDKKEILTKNSIMAGQNGPNFREVYQDLELKENRYMRVDLMNSTGDSGLVVVLDFKTKQAIKAYGIILLKATSGQNGQIPIPTENK